MNGRKDEAAEIGITLCMIVKNEEETIGRCLLSAKPFVSAIVVVDTGSDDRTAEIAREFGALVVTFPWSGHFGEARNAAFPHVRTPWILMLDADEEIVSWDERQMSSALADPETAGLYVSIRNYSEPPPGGRYEQDAAVRLFRPLPGAAYRGRIHEDISKPLTELYPQAKLGSASVGIAHYGYAWDAEAAGLKHERNLRLLRLAIEEEPEEPYYVYALGTEYFIRAQYADAAAAFDGIDGRLPENAGYAADCMYKHAFAHYRSGNRERALTLVELGLERSGEYADLLELKAVLLIECGRLEAAYLCVSGIKRETEAEASRIDYVHGIIAEKLFNFAEAADFYTRALLADPRLKHAYSRLLDIRLALCLINDAASDEFDCTTSQIREEIVHDSVNKAMLNIVRDLVELHHAMNGEDKWRSFFLHALKWGLGGYSLQVMSAMRDTEAQPELLYLKAVCHAQQGETKAAVRMLNELSGKWGGLQVVITGWAALHADYERNGAGGTVVLDRLNEHGSRYPELEPLVRSLLGQEHRAVDERLYERTAFALLLTGAWSAFGYVFEKISGRFARLIPKEWIPALMRAPHSIQKLVCQSAASRYDALAFSEQIAVAALYGMSGQKAEALRLFTILSSRNPDRLEPRIGMHAVLCQSNAALFRLVLNE